MVRSAESRSWFRRLALPVRITSIVVVMLLVVSAGYWVYLNVSTCGPDVNRIDGQCIGVTDGSVLLAPGLADVLGKIRQENEQVDRSGRKSVSVAYLLALPNPSSNDPLAVSLRHDLEGAHLAQRVENGAKSLNDEPLIRLLVANDGDRSSQWQKVVPALVDKVDGPERLVAVVASGTTVAARQSAIGALTDQNIPVIASRLTGDDLTSESAPAFPVQGLARPAPSNSDQAAAAAAYLKPNTARALLVQSTDPDDTFSRSLGDAFQHTFPDDTHTLLEPIETYNPQLGGVATTMRSMLVNICQQRPDVIYFAGRGAELQAFVTAMPTRPCQEIPINIMTGDSAVHFANALAQGNHELLKSLEGNVSVRYTGLAHPASWDDSPDGFAPGPIDYFMSSCEKCFQNLFPGEFPGAPLNDGTAILGHDAIATAAAAIGTENDRPELIIQQFKRMHGPQAVAGASGWVSLDERGNPVNKAIPILELKPDGTVVFIKLSAPRGSPCRPDVPALC